MSSFTVLPPIRRSGTLDSVIRPQNMHPASCRNALAALAFMALGVGGSCAFAQSSPTQWLSVDMPHGGCRLTVGEDGAASIHFGATPRWVRVPPGTFIFEELAKTLRASAYPQTARKTEGPPVGSLSLPDESDLLFIDDHEAVRALLARAWGARARPQTPREVEDHAWVSKTCSLK